MKKQLKSSKSLKHNARTYGISEEHLYSMLEASKGRCSICGSIEPLVIDHCHKTEIVRGLLCDLCNIGLGAFKDNRMSLVRAINYLTASKRFTTKGLDIREKL